VIIRGKDRPIVTLKGAQIRSQVVQSGALVVERLNPLLPLTAKQIKLRSADKIDLFLRGMAVRESEEERLEALMEKIRVYDKNEKIGVSGGQKRQELKLLPPDTRKWVFDEVEKGFSIPEAQKEADRCLRCVRVGLFAV